MITLNEFIGYLSRDRYVGGLIIGDANNGKTKYVKKFIEVNKDINCLYVDFIEYVKTNNLQEKILTITSNDFLGICKAIIKNNPMVTFIDNFDFIINLWDQRKKKEFVEYVIKLEKSVVANPVIWIIQTEEIFYDLYKKQSNNQVKHIIQFGEHKDLAAI
ncbi:MAG TPA: hypothetical protein PKK13_05970 [Spirochaetota bacterium]|nr:hypothetical protein [Spirochaetota bacterium]